MAKASEQFRQSDVTMWGIVALMLGAIAVMGANISAVIPQSLLAGLHKTRLEGASMEQLRSQLAELRDETVRLKRESNVLTARFALGEQSENEITRRVGALEVSLPRLLETLPGSNIDLTNTAAISTQPTLVYQTEGGSVAIRQQPMPRTQPATGAQQLPAPVVNQLAAIPLPNEAAYGIALGASVSFEQAPAAWRDLSMKLGPLLFGLAPLLVDEANGDDKRIVVGPINQLSEATALCTRLERISVACLPMPFTGTPLAY